MLRCPPGSGRLAPAGPAASGARQGLRGIGGLGGLPCTRTVGSVAPVLAGCVSGLVCCALFLRRASALRAARVSEGRSARVWSSSAGQLSAAGGRSWASSSPARRGGPEAGGTGSGAVSSWSLDSCGRQVGRRGGGRRHVALPGAGEGRARAVPKSVSILVAYA